MCVCVCVCVCMCVCVCVLERQREKKLKKEGLEASCARPCRDKTIQDSDIIGKGTGTQFNNQCFFGSRCLLRQNVEHKRSRRKKRLTANQRLNQNLTRLKK